MSEFLPDVGLLTRLPETSSLGSLIQQAESELSTANLLHSRQLYTEALSISPRSITAYLGRSLVHLKLGFSDLAAGDTYRALLLIDSARERDDYGDMNIDEMEAMALLRHIAALNEIGCYEDAVRYGEIGSRRFPTYNFELPDKNAVPKKGEWRREVYPWNDKEPDRFSAETLAVLNAAMAKCSSKAELRVVELPILQRDLSFRGDGDRLSDKHLGVFAKEDIFLGETFFSEASPLTVVADPENSSLCEYCGGALGGHYEVCDECWEGDEDSGVMWCSVMCREKAFEKYHPALCGRDFGWLYRDINATASTNSAYSLLLLKTFAMSITLDTHPLALPDVKYLYGVSRPPLKHIPAIALPFNFTHQVMQPIQMLQEMDIDIFDPKYLDFFDLWVMQTVRAKFISVASARMSVKTRRTELAAVHTLYSMFNHSCEPSVTWQCENEVKFTGFSRNKSFYGRTSPVVAVRKGEECMTHYCDVRMGYKERQRDAFGSLGGKCVCNRCVKEELDDKRPHGCRRLD